MTTTTTLEELARSALEGDRAALESLARALQGDIYGLALRMLWNREDAEDATQEILVRVVTRLSQFDFRSRLKTWVYRVAVNYILDARKSAIERLHLSFERFAEDLAEGVQPAAPDATERSLLIEEVKVACALAMLQCLDRPHRLAYVLGEIMDFSGPEAADALGISPALFRKRLAARAPGDRRVLDVALWAGVGLGRLPVPSTRPAGGRGEPGRVAAAAVREPCHVLPAGTRPGPPGRRGALGDGGPSLEPAEGFVDRLRPPPGGRVRPTSRRVGLVTRGGLRP